MQIISELETRKRGCYAGAVGYFGFDGALDCCIALRSIVLKGGRAYLRAGAGIVADSDPTSEYQETVNKAMAMVDAHQPRHGRVSRMLLIIDNYDSFTYNLVQYLSVLGCDVIVKRNDEITVVEIEVLNPERICISPGPGEPEDAGISNELIRQLGSTKPILGVCLGHQCIGAVFGGEVVPAARLMHGKTSPVSHQGAGVFADLPNPFEATRYHSLIVRRENATLLSRNYCGNQPKAKSWACNIANTRFTACSSIRNQF